MTSRTLRLKLRLQNKQIVRLPHVRIAPPVRPIPTATIYIHPLDRTNNKTTMISLLDA